MKHTLKKTTLQVKGMHCGGCAAAISAALRRLPTVHVERIGHGEVTVVRDPSAVTYGSLVNAIEHAGYSVVNHATLANA